jgi:hypothetical protein
MRRTIIGLLRIDWPPRHGRLKTMANSCSAYCVREGDDDSNRGSLPVSLTNVGRL